MHYCAMTEDIPDMTMKMHPSNLQSFHDQSRQIVIRTFDDHASFYHYSDSPLEHKMFCQQINLPQNSVSPFLCLILNRSSIRQFH